MFGLDTRTGKRNTRNPRTEYIPKVGAGTQTNDVYAQFGNRYGGDYNASQDNPVADNPYGQASGQGKTTDLFNQYLNRRLFDYRQRQPQIQQQNSAATSIPNQNISNFSDNGQTYYQKRPQFSQQSQPTQQQFQAQAPQQTSSSGSGAWLRNTNEYDLGGGRYETRVTDQYGRTVSSNITSYGTRNQYNPNTQR